jgi:mRNA interferase RelE/StbE
MSKTLVFATSAAKAFAKLPETVQERILDALLMYGTDGSGDIKRMVGAPGLRLREGDYRVLFLEHEHELEIRAVGHRESVYR